jgi:hypothetical protein
MKNEKYIDTNSGIAFKNEKASEKNEKIENAIESIGNKTDVSFLFSYVNNHNILIPKTILETIFTS